MASPLQGRLEVFAHYFDWNDDGVDDGDEEENYEDDEDNDDVNNDDDYDDDIDDHGEFNILATLWLILLRAESYPSLIFCNPVLCLFLLGFPFQRSSVCAKSK